jgi:hypothetical protein
MHRSECLEQYVREFCLSLHQRTSRKSQVQVVAAGTEILSPLCDCVKQVGGRSSLMPNN